jgi:phosphomannomutase
VKRALLFDIDNTLTPPRQPLAEPMVKVLKNLTIPFHVTAGSHMGLLQEQFFQPLYDLGFRGSFEAFISNGGIHCHCDYSNGMSIDLVSAFNIRNHLGEANYQFLFDILNKVQTDPIFALPSTLTILGETITYREAMVNFVPMGRTLVQTREYRENRSQFVAFDRATGFREKLLQHLRETLACLIESHQLTITLGGETSFDISVAHKDKTNAVWTLLENGIENLIFIGDALFAGGNDAPIGDIVLNWANTTPCPLETIQVVGWQDTREKLYQRGFIHTIGD